jgi:FKBP-type peptidyl-prolyl cis-trans isomerase
VAKQWTLALGLALLTAVAAAQDTSTFKIPKEKLSYALGMQIGSGFRKEGLDLDAASVSKGFADAFSRGKTLLTEDEMRTVLTSAQEEFRKKEAALRAEKAQAAQKEGSAFLAANKNKNGVTTLPSGLQYKILKAGTREKPELDDTVVCNYRGTFIDGTEFDSSSKHNGPATFPVKGVIRGWTEALLLMPVGSKWQLFVPPQLAYGENGSGQVIPPNSTLIFEVELLSIHEKHEHERDRE